jgi:hypothetical protein
MNPESLAELCIISYTGFGHVTCASGRDIGRKRGMDVTGITSKSQGSKLLQLIANMSRNNLAVDVCSI